MYRFLVIALLLTVGCLSAQDTLAIASLDQQPLLKIAGVKGAPADINQENLFLTSIYSRVGYPRYARENGVRALIEVRYVIDTTGTVTVEQTRALTEEEQKDLLLPKSAFIIITGYSSSGYGAPRETRNEKRLAKAYLALEEEVNETVTELPRFMPGTKDGIKVVARDTRYFVFRLE